MRISCNKLNPPVAVLRPRAHPLGRRSIGLAAALVLAVAPSTSRAEEVYWKTKDLLRDFFRSSERVTYVTVRPSEDPEIERALGYRPARPSYPVFVAVTKGKVDGYAFIDEEMGQHLPITFGVKLSPEGAIERLEVMVYREGYGDEIREKRFHQQFKGKRAYDSMRLGDDVMAISGATISSKSMTVGVRRAAVFVEAVLKKEADGSAVPRAKTDGARR